MEGHALAHAGSSRSAGAAAAAADEDSHATADEQLFKQDMNAAFADEEDEEENENAAASAAGSSIASHAPPDVSLLSALASDASLQSLPPLPLQAIHTAVTCLQHAIHSETVARALMLYRYLRLLQKLMAVRRYTRLTAARKLNRWIAAAYSQQQPDLLPRIRHDAKCLFNLFSEPADDDEWWPRQLRAVAAAAAAAAAAAGGQTKHLLRSLFMLDHHHKAICEVYGQAERLRLMRYYLLTKKWSAREIEADLLQDGVIKAEAAPPLPPPPLLPQQQPEQPEAKDGAESHEGTRDNVSSAFLNRTLSFCWFVDSSHMLVFASLMRVAGGAAVGFVSPLDEDKENADPQGTWGRGAVTLKAISSDQRCN